jgi:hypothetical protein
MGALQKAATTLVFGPGWPSASSGEVIFINHRFLIRIRVPACFRNGASEPCFESTETIIAKAPEL